ncbi:MAG: hypothetical protein Q4C22_00610 [Bacillota bacterium]|nr:hypothetical protein [Bacillota bacterium]
MKQRRGRPFMELLRGNIFAIVLFAGAAILFSGGLDRAAAAQETEALRTAEDSLRRAAVSCYALEGSYPSSYEYIRENYGVALDESKYAVYYEIFASNIMPEITVVERQGAE